MNIGFANEQEQIVQMESNVQFSNDHINDIAYDYDRILELETIKNNFTNSISLLNSNFANLKSQKLRYFKKITLITQFLIELVENNNLRIEEKKESIQKSIQQAIENNNTIFIKQSCIDDNTYNGLINTQKAALDEINQLNFLLQKFSEQSQKFKHWKNIKKGVLKHQQKKQQKCSNNLTLLRSFLKKVKIYLNNLV